MSEVGAGRGREPPNRSTVIAGVMAWAALAFRAVVTAVLLVFTRMTLLVEGGPGFSVKSPDAVPERFSYRLCFVQPEVEELVAPPTIAELAIAWLLLQAMPRSFMYRLLWAKVPVAVPPSSTALLWNGGPPLMPERAIKQLLT